MTTTTFKWCLVAAIIAAGVAVPLLIRHRAAVEWLEANASLLEQSAQLAQATAENLRLSNLVARAEAPALSGDELQELLRLRGEVSRLRAQTNALPRLLAENLLLQSRPTNAPGPVVPLPAAERDRALAAEIRAAMQNILAGLQTAMEKFAVDHGGKAPTDFAALRKYFPEVEGRRMAGLYTFEFVRDEGPSPADALILRESGTHRGPLGNPARFYAYRNGTIVEASPADGNFGYWEWEHQAQPPSTER